MMPVFILSDKSVFCGKWHFKKRTAWNALRNVHIVINTWWVTESRPDVLFDGHVTKRGRGWAEKHGHECVIDGDWLAG